MNELKTKLVLHDDMNTNNVQSLMNELTPFIMDNYKIFNGKNAYSILEMEYYIHTPLHQDKRSNSDTTTVYSRPGKKAGDMFFHFSGMDICFEPDQNSYGGILIRSLVDESDPSHIIKGPCKCLVDLMNTATEVPHVIREKNILEYSKPEKCKRKNLNSENSYLYNYTRKLK